MLNPRVILIVAVLALAASAIMLVVVFASLNTVTTITDPARYSECLRHFPGDLTAMVPREIPADSVQVSMTFAQTSSIIAPSSTRLEVEFVVPPGRATELLEQARSSLPEATVNRTTEAEIQASRGDQVAIVSIDPDTGKFAIVLHNN